jgi:hypothetical protein
VTDDGPPDNVLRPTFGQRDELGKQTEIKRGRRKCHHRGTLDLDEETRAVTCGACGDPLDAFEVLLEYANRERRWQYYDKEVREAAERLAELKKEEVRVKARTALASRKDAAAAVEHEQQATFVRRRAIADKARDIAECARQIARLARVDADVFAGGARRKREGGK